MVISDDLFRLVKSLSKTEKAYFKKYSKLHVLGEKNNYIRLFDFIADMDVYNESLIIKEFQGEKFIRQLSVAKNYLYGSILRALKAYRKTDKKREEAKELMDDITILIEKRLFRQAEKLLRKCRKISENYEVYSQLLQVLVAESKIAIAQRSYDEKTDKILDKNYKERNEILDTIKNAFEFDLLEYNITSLISRHSDSKDKNYLGRLKEIVSSDILSCEQNAVSLTARLKYNHIHATYHYATGEMEESYRYLSREIEILSEKRELLEDRLTDYFILLSNRLLISLELGKYKELEANIRHIRSELSRKEVKGNERLRFFIINNSYLIEMNYLNRIGRFSQTLEVNRQYREKLSPFGYKMIKADEFWLNSTLCHAYFGLGQLARSLEHLNYLLNDPEAEQKYSNILFARLFSLILHYEMGNIDLLEYLIKSTYRYILKRKKLYRFEILIFSFLKKLPDAVSERELKEKFLELKTMLKKQINEESVKDAMKYFDFISWLESKIESRGLAEVIAGKL
ncbi:MAG: hypothetical protein K8I03_14020 [Ignavibacteria bacterium]|nr:hypothetical protein [Ignavibacteria bacterium]